MRGAVLFVDPDRRRVDDAAALLKPEFEVVSAMDASAALSDLRRRPYDVMVVVHPLPSGSGLELLRQARAQRPGTLRVVATEARDSASLVEAVNEARVSYILRLPWEGAVLRELIDGLAGLLHARRAEQAPMGTLHGSSSSNDAFTGVLSLPSFYRRVQTGLSRLAAGTEATVLCAEVDALPHQTAGAASQAQLRLLAACALEAAAAHPGSYTARAGSRILAFVPGCGAADAAAVGAGVAAGFARSTALTLPATASVGVAVHPRHGNNSLGLLELAHEGLYRAQRMGGGQVAECLPRVLMVGPLNIFRKVISSLTRRDDLVLRLVEQPDGLAARLAAERPALLVANLLGPRTVPDEIATALSRPEHASLRVVFVAAKEARPEYSARAGRVAGSLLLCGDDRLSTRTLEAIVGGLGLQNKHELRLSARIRVHVALGAGKQQRQPAVLSNLTDGAALLTVPTRVSAGDRLSFFVEAGADRAIEVPATVRRASRLGIGEFDVALRLEPIDEKKRAALAAALAAAAPLEAPADTGASPRALDRYVPDRFGRIKVRLKPVGQTPVTYAQVANLSIGGFLGVLAARVEPPVPVGGWAETMLYDRLGSVQCVSQAMHREQRLDGRWQVGFRFVNLEPEAYRRLDRMIAECRVGPARPRKLG